MKHIKIISSLLFAGLALASCRDEYVAPLVDSDTNILVVEGNLDASGGITSIRLSRSGKIDGYNTIIAEDGAQIQVEAESGGVQGIPDAGGGFYRNTLALQVGQKYRVRILTDNGNEYLSNYITVKETPPIDSITWKRDAEGIVISANAHDDNGNTTYYRWDYDETWEIRTYYFSLYLYESLTNTVRKRDIPAEQVTTCWKYNSSSNILLASSARLQSDRIAEAPLLRAFNGDERMAVRYSILVRQYAMEKEAYEFYDLMKKNTESIGSIFDPQPSEIRGNFTCLTDEREPVIGHVTASTVTEKRIFISAADLDNWRLVENCPVQEVTPDSIEFYFKGEGFMPYDVKENNGAIELYYGSYAGCVDCRKRGGSLQRPSYW
jgi:hypothetical protein